MKAKHKITFVETKAHSVTSASCSTYQKQNTVTIIN